MTTTSTLPEADARFLLKCLRLLAQHHGPLLQAGDHAPIPLLAAQVNGELRQPGWCRCSLVKGTPEPTEVYFRRPAEGASWMYEHGWMCANCRRLTQAG